MKKILIVGVLLLSGCTPRLFGYADEQPEFWHRPPIHDTEQYVGSIDCDDSGSCDIYSAQ